MKITFLGTGTSQGIPVIACQCKVCLSQNPKDKRLRSSVLIEHEDTAVVIDSGPDFRQQMLIHEVKAIDGLVFTHEHKDHIAGLDDIRAFNYVLKKKIDVYASDRVQVALHREFPYIFDDNKYPGIPEIELITINSKPFNIGSLKLVPINVLHYRLPVFGFRIGDFTYVTDANFISEEEKQKIKGSRVVVLNALRKEPHVSHFTLEQATELINELNPEKGLITHLSHQMGKNDEINNELPSNIQCAYDGLVIEL